jgi:hypothetical protein
MGPGPGVKGYSAGGGLSTPTFRSASQNHVDSANSVTVTAPAGEASGDTLVAVVTQDGTGATLGCPTGWTLQHTDNITHGDQQTVALCTKIAAGSDSFVFTGSTGNNIAACVAAYSGGNLTTPIETFSSNDPDTGTAPTSPVTVTGTGITTSNTDVIVWLASVDTNGLDGVYTAPSGMTLRTSTPNSDSFNSCGLADLSQSSSGATGNEAGTWTLTGAQGNYVAYVVAIKGR